MGICTKIVALVPLYFSLSYGYCEGQTEMDMYADCTTFVQDFQTLGKNTGITTFDASDTYYNSYIRTCNSAKQSLSVCPNGMDLFCNLNQEWSFYGYSGNGDSSQYTYAQYEHWALRYKVKEIVGSAQCPTPEPTPYPTNAPISCDHDTFAVCTTYANSLEDSGKMEAGSKQQYIVKCDQVRKLAECNNALEDFCSLQSGYYYSGYDESWNIQYYQDALASREFSACSTSATTSAPTQAPITSIPTSKPTNHPISCDHNTFAVCTAYANSLEQDDKMEAGAKEKYIANCNQVRQLAECNNALEDFCNLQYGYYNNGYDGTWNIQNYQGFLHAVVQARQFPACSTSTPTLPPTQSPVASIPTSKTTSIAERTADAIANIPTTISNPTPTSPPTVRKIQQFSKPYENGKIAAVIIKSQLSNKYIQVFKKGFVNGKGEKFAARSKFAAIPHGNGSVMMKSTVTIACLQLNYSQRKRKYAIHGKGDCNANEARFIISSIYADYVMLKSEKYPNLCIAVGSDGNVFAGSPGDSECYLEIYQE